MRVGTEGASVSRPPAFLLESRGPMNLNCISALTLLVFAQTAPVESTATREKVSTPAEVKASFEKLLDRPRVPLDVVVEGVQTDKGLTTERLSFASEKKADGTVERVPVLVVR